jgi:hypothetical protein
LIQDPGIGENDPGIAISLEIAKPQEELSIAPRRQRHALIEK